MKLKPEATGTSLTGCVGYMKPKALVAAGACSSTEESAAGYMKPKAEGGVEAGASSTSAS